MAYRILADLVLVLHFCFVLFTVFGGLLVLRWRKIALLHLPTVFWGILIECFFWACPLTLLENWLRGLGGEAGYDGGFIDYYVSAILYAHVSPQFRVALGLLLIAFNLFVYFHVLRRLMAETCA